MNAVTTINASTALGTVSQRALAIVAAQRDKLAALSAGITTGYAVLGFRGKVWRLKYNGEETDLTMNVEGQLVPRPFVDVVIVNAADHLAKNYYAEGYREGSDAPPDCFSNNGFSAEQSSPKRQGSLRPDGTNSGDGVCAACPFNRFGSKVSADGTGKGKACADTKRLAIVPLADLKNEGNGGAMLARVPAASLGELKTYNDKLMQHGHPYFAVGTRMYFDQKEAYPKILFAPVRALEPAEFDIIADMMESPSVLRIIEGNDAPAAPTPAAPAIPAMDQMQADGFAALAAGGAAPAPAAPAPAPVPVAVAPAPAPAPAPEPAPTAPALPAGMTPEMYAQFMAFQQAQAAQAVAPTSRAPATAPQASATQAFSPDQVVEAPPAAPAAGAPSEAPQMAYAEEAAPAGFDDALASILG